MNADVQKTIPNRKRERHSLMRSKGRARSDFEATTRDVHRAAQVDKAPWRLVHLSNAIAAAFEYLPIGLLRLSRRRSGPAGATR